MSLSGSIISTDEDAELDRKCKELEDTLRKLKLENAQAEKALSKLNSEKTKLAIHAIQLTTVKEAVAELQTLVGTPQSPVYLAMKARREARTAKSKTQTMPMNSVKKKVPTINQ